MRPRTPSRAGSRRGSEVHQLEKETEVGVTVEDGGRLGCTLGDEPRPAILLR